MLSKDKLGRGLRRFLGQTPAESTVSAMRPDKVALGHYSAQFLKPQRMETTQLYTPTQVNNSHQGRILFASVQTCTRQPPNQTPC